MAVASQHRAQPALSDLPELAGLVRAEVSGKVADEQTLQSTPDVAGAPWREKAEARRRAPG